MAAIDLDGTLLTPDKQVTPRSVEALRAWQARGFKVVLATARPFYRIGTYLRMLDLANEHNYAIAFNGGMVMRADGGERLHSHSFSAAEIADAVAYGGSIGAPMFVYTEDRIVSSEDNELYRRKNPDVNFEVSEDLRSVDWTDRPVYKIAYVGTPDAVKEMRKGLPFGFEQKYEVSSSVPQFVDLVPRGTSKARALEMVAARVGVLASEMVAFGDEDNDAALLGFAGLAVAVGNASDVIKEMADVVCGPNTDDGVARFLEGLLADDPDG
ncbi:Cof-type HAD-IIB family hydrolase [Micromonospora sp. NPDC018662]|uniref:Cof-type HAD-IIB family hydrolase n=1 Tax=Micromonospora sp. NPDC018662 TaxID=3364238 RepID=UPI0037BD7522